MDFSSGFHLFPHYYGQGSTLFQGQDFAILLPFVPRPFSIFLPPNTTHLILQSLSSVLCRKLFLIPPVKLTSFSVVQ